MSLESALDFTLPAEGGFVDDPADHGGATNHGITQATYDDYRTSHKLQKQSVSLITDSEVEDIYDYMYWVPAKCPYLLERLGVCHFDWAVNHGIVGALQTLQQAVGVEADGMWGPHTAAAIASSDEATVIQSYLNLRRAWYNKRVADKPDQAKFLPGWLRRVDQLSAYLETL